MADTDKIKATVSAPIAFKVPVWVAAAALAAVLASMVGGVAWLNDAATNSKLMVQKMDQQVTATGELKTEVKELRTELGADNQRLRAEVNSLRERVAKLEASK